MQRPEGQEVDDNIEPLPQQYIHGSIVLAINLHGCSAFRGRARLAMGDGHSPTIGKQTLRCCAPNLTGATNDECCLAHDQACAVFSGEMISSVLPR
jgi:hypothetical protein